MTPYRLTYLHPQPGARQRRFLTVPAAGEDQARRKLLALIPGVEIVGCEPGEARRYLPHAQKRLTAREEALPAGRWLVRDLRGQWERRRA